MYYGSFLLFFMNLLFQIPPLGSSLYKLGPGLFQGISRSIIWFSGVGLNAMLNPVVYYFR